MSDKTCGDCGNFQPKDNQKFFNCTSARQAGIRYGMQVRADTGACEAFTHKALTSSPTPRLSTERAEPDAHCLDRTIIKIALIIAIIVAIALLSWLLYSCVTESGAVPATTPTPAPVDSFTPTSQPSPTPLPPYIVQYFNISANSTALGYDKIITVYSVSRITSYTLLTGRVINAPPGYILIHLQLNGFNTSGDSIYVNPNDFTVIDSGGYRYTPQLEVSPYYVGNLFGGTILPGQIKDGKLLYVVPITASSLELSYILDPTSVPSIQARWKMPW